MSWEPNTVIIESLIETYQELKSSWNGKDLGLEKKMNEVAADLESRGINVDAM